MEIALPLEINFTDASSFLARKLDSQANANYEVVTPGSSNDLEKFVNNIISCTVFTSITAPIGGYEKLRTPNLEAMAYADSIIRMATIDITHSRLDEEIKFRNEKEIAVFLDVHSEVKSYLAQAQKTAREYFPSGQFAVELVNDPESESDSRQILFFYILTNILPEEALRHLDNVDEELFEKLQLDSRYFNIDIEFQK